MGFLKHFRPAAKDIKLSVQNITYDCLRIQSYIPRIDYLRKYLSSFPNKSKVLITYYNVSFL